MASLKRIGFYLGDEKITVVEFDKNAPVQVAFSALGSKSNAPSPFSSNLTEEIQINTTLKKLFDDNKIGSGTVYVSLPMKEIVLRSFSIPFVKQEDIQNAIKFESKKYIPFDIQDLFYSFHTVPFMEGTNKRLQVIFFAARKDVVLRYERIFKLVNAEVSYCEPYIVSLTKALLFRKEVKASDHFAFLILDKTLGRICFINKGIPQFIREFPVNFLSQGDEEVESVEALNMKISNEVLNSFDFYARQFSGEKIDQVLVSSDFIQKDLLDILDKELKIKIVKFSPVITTGGLGQQSNGMDAIYAMGVCVAPPIESLAKFNFLRTTPKLSGYEQVITVLKPFKSVIIVFVGCVLFLIAVIVFYLMQQKLVEIQFDQISAKEGVYRNEPQVVIQTELQQNIDKLAEYKAVRIKSNISDIVLDVGSHLPLGAKLSEFNITYEQSGSKKSHMSIDLSGEIQTQDPNQEIALVNQIFSDIKNDKDLARFIKKVDLVSFNPQIVNGRQVTAFNIHCS